MNTRHLPADHLVDRAVAALLRVISGGVPSARAIPMVAAELGVSADELRDAYRAAEFA